MGRIDEYERIIKERGRERGEKEREGERKGELVE